MTDQASPSAPTPLSERPIFLLTRLGSYAAARFGERLALLGLHPRHFNLLSHLAAGDGQTQQQLADVMGIHRNLMVGLVDDLEDRKLVERRRHPVDRRAHALHLTPAARDLLGQASHAADAQDAELLAGLDDADQVSLVTLLQRVAAHAGVSVRGLPGPKERPDDSDPDAERSVPA